MSDFKFTNTETELVVSLFVSKEQVDKEYQKLETEALKKIKVNGYRAGKAPKEVLRARLNSKDLLDRVLQNLSKENLNEVYKQLMERKEPVTFAYTIDLKEEENGLTFDYKFAKVPTVSDLDVKSAKTELKLEKVTDKDVLESIETRLNEGRSRVKVEDEAKKGDEVLFDFKGYIDGEAFEGGEAEDYSLVLGSAQFIAGFEEQLLGKKAGWKGEIKATFPSTYYVKNYRDKEATFEINLKEVRRVNSLKLDSKEFKDSPLGSEEYLGQYKVFVKKDLVVSRFIQSQRDFLDELVKELSQSVKFHISDLLLKEKIAQLDKQFNDQLKQYKVKRKEYLKVIKATEEDIQVELKTSAVNEYKLSYVYQELLKEFKKEFTEEEKKQYQEVFDALKFTSPSNDLLDQLAVLEGLLEKTSRTKELKAWNDYKVYLVEELKKLDKEIQSMQEKQTQEQAEEKVENKEEK
ncbi:trigger factor [Mycoplasmopsis synoviae]|uniref:trigger factor n=1 Tax=Mycoplasmopsis synoviae TaxID=2109 RepID=UPI003563B15C